MYFKLKYDFYINRFFSFIIIVIITKEFFIHCYNKQLTIYEYDLEFMVVTIKILDIL